MDNWIGRLCERRIWGINQSCGCCAMLGFIIYLYVLILYWNPYLVYLHHWLPPRLGICVPWPSSGISWLYDHESSWCCSIVGTVSSCDELFVCPTHARGGTLDLLMTDVPDRIRIGVAPIVRQLNHSSLSAVISTAQAVPNLWVSRKVLLKHHVNWDWVFDAIRDLP